MVHIKHNYVQIKQNKHNSPHNCAKSRANIIKSGLFAEIALFSQNKQNLVISAEYARFLSPELGPMSIVNGHFYSQTGNSAEICEMGQFAASAKLGGPFRARFWGAYMKLRWAFSGFG